MGYYTFYELEVSCSTAQDSELLDKVQLVLDEISDAPVEGLVRGGFEIKWYDHDKDMIELSGRFPGVLFTLRGDGEDSDDKWISYYMDGKVQSGHAQIIYPEFDPEKLEEPRHRLSF